MMKPIPFLFPALALAIALPSLASAANRTFNRPTGDYADPTNWTGGALPAVGDSGFITEGRIATVNSAVDETPAILYIGQGGGAGTLNVTGGSLTLGQALLGRGGPVTNVGTLDVSGGQIDADNIFLGTDTGTDHDLIQNAPGRLIVSGGTVNVGTGGLRVGDTSIGALTQTGGTIQVNGGIFVGLRENTAKSLAAISGGTFSSATGINVGSAGGPVDRTLIVSGPAVVTWDTDASNGPSDLFSLYGALTISGKDAKLSSPNTEPGTFNVRSSATLTYILAPDGTTSPIDIKAAQVGFQTGGRLVIDGKRLALTAGNHSSILIEHTGYALAGDFGARELTVEFVNFPATCKPDVEFGPKSVNLKIVASVASQ